MAKAIIARQQGDQYQARFFWLHACRLFQPHTKVVRVGYEVDQPRGFDDVVVFYDPPIPNEFGKHTSTDYFQIKFHTDHAGAFTCQALMNPTFIGASSQSLLQRLVAAQERCPIEKDHCRFFIVTPWVIDPNDPLATFVSQQNGELRFNRLFDGKSRSQAGNVRAAWCTHLGLVSDDALAEVLRPLRIKANSHDLHSMHQYLNISLTAAGFSPVDDGRVVHPYDDLIGRLYAQGRTEFTRTDIQQICEREGLWRGGLANHEEAVQIGIRSFMRWADYLEDRTEHLLCLIRHFDERQIRDPESWGGIILPELNQFFHETMREPKPYHLYLETHTSIAFAAGYCLDPKSGVNVTPIQSTRMGKLLWPSSDTGVTNTKLWKFDEINLSCSESGHDIALAVSITHDVLGDVQTYVQDALPQVKRILSAAIAPAPSQRAIQDGSHALQLVEQLVRYVRQERSSQERRGQLHVFLSVPNAFSFFLGQVGRSFGPCRLYEFDFDRNLPEGYSPSLIFPPPPPALNS